MLIILTYHAILDNERQAFFSAVDPHYSITRKIFEQQMRFLKESNLEVLGLSAAINNSDNGLAAKKYVVITFDDGLKSHYQVAKPILEKYGFIGHFFVTANKIGQDGYMSWKNIKDLCRAGHIIGSHGMSHRILTALGKEEVAEELKFSRLAIAQMIGKSIDYFSVPGGFYNSHMRRIAKDTGYKAVLTSSSGLNKKVSSLYRLKRIFIKKNTSMEKFRLIIEKGQMPIIDKVGYYSKTALRKMLGDERYHKLRELVLVLND